MVRVFFFICMSVVTLTGFSASKLPHLGDPASNIISPEKIDLISRYVLANIAQTTPIIYDPIINDYINELGNYIVSHSEYPATEIRFVALRSDHINAFALPGNIIGLNSELILQARTEGELAGVVAHEVSHITQHHFTRMIEKQQYAYFSQIATILASMMVAAASSPRDAQAALVASSAAHQQKMIGYVREHEYEADRVGTNVLTKAGYPATDMASFFTRLPQGTYHNTIFEAIMTHPMPSKRYAEALYRHGEEKKISNLQKLEFKLIQARIEALTTRNKSTLRKKIARLKATELAQPYNQYLQALSFAQTQQVNKASYILQTLYFQYPESLTIATTYLLSLMAQQQFTTAEFILNEVNQVFWDAYPIMLIQAKMNALQGNINDAKFILRKIIHHFSYQVEPYQMLAIIETEQSDKGLSYYYMGEYFLNSGKLHQALVQFQLATNIIAKDSRFYRYAVQKRDLLKEFIS